MIFIAKPSLAQFYLTAFGDLATHKLSVDEFSDFTMSYANKFKKKVSNRTVLETQQKTLNTAILAFLTTR
ncbi:MAG: hypothetical protein EBX06_02485 [Rhodobacteraceae bacterium]|nr:hypothetical protein [Paracoccaceae bacterium]NCV29164.1 hypothetical protein [Paracoccaceae bacterium]NCV66959.1 hypothetical protein [Paracoccaceae bacterium]NCW03259.1 hypothetical protein [Paracoccaceae bacterium]NCW65115.1 hypothetical protein [Paracoccaceae bacterium]